MNRRRRRNGVGNSLRILLTLLSLQRFWSRHHRANASVVTSHPSASASAAGDDGGGADMPTSWSTALLEQTSKSRDPYVEASPLSVAAVCRDGIALVSLHHVEIEDSPDGVSLSTANEFCKALELSSNCNESYDNETVGNIALIESNNSHETSHEPNEQLSLSRKFHDLPLSSRGPLRIEPIYENMEELHSPPPMSLLTAGWRTDGMTLADAARALMMEEVRLFCLPSLTLHEAAATDSIENVGDGGEGREDKHSRDKLEDGVKKMQCGANNDAVLVRNNAPDTIMGQQPYFGRRIAEGLSYYLAKCVFSEGVRSLSCIGLLACGSGRRRMGESLYLIDATGTHRVRAHAIGKGSSALHARLVFADFSDIDCHEGLRVLLRLIAEEGGLLPRHSIADKKLVDVTDTNAKSLQNENSASGLAMAKAAFVSKGDMQLNGEGQSATLRRGQWNLPSKTAAELAVLKSGEGRMRRVRLSTLFVDNQD